MVHVQGVPLGESQGVQNHRQVNQRFVEQVMHRNHVDNLRLPEVPTHRAVAKMDDGDTQRRTGFIQPGNWPLLVYVGLVHGPNATPGNVLLYPVRVIEI